MALSSNTFARKWVAKKFSDPTVQTEFMNGSLSKDVYLEMIIDWIGSKEVGASKAPDYNNAAWAYEAADRLGQAKALEDVKNFIKSLTKEDPNNV